jgi:TolB-like protein/Flp pilus assembly protein TadD
VEVQVTASSRPIFLFSGYAVDGDRRELRRGSVLVPVEPQVFDLLLHLLANRHRVSSRDDLVAAVWRGRIVSESTIASRLNAARRAIGDSGEQQRLIRTVIGKGVRFVGAVQELHEFDPPAAVACRPSVAVLPFANRSSDPEQEYFAHGVADDILTELSRNRSLLVIARASSFAFDAHPLEAEQTGRELGARYVIGGSVRRDSRRVSVSAQLIDTEIGGQIWAERIEHDLADLFRVQDQIVRAVVTAIDPAISLAEQQRAIRKPAGHLSAWEAWQRALWHWSKDGDLSSRRDFLQRAVALDPYFAPPRAMLAWLHLSESTRGGGRPLQESLKLAEAEARSALDLDPRSSVARAAMAWVLDHQGQRLEALDEAEAAIALNPNDPQGHLVKGHVLGRSGRPAEAQEPLAMALRLDPRGPTAPAVMHNQGVSRYLDRDYVAAVTTTRRTIRDYPKHPRPYVWLAAALGQLGRDEEANSALRAAIASAPAYLEYKTSGRAPYMSPEGHRHLLEGLHKAGWRMP